MKKLIVFILIASLVSFSGCAKRSIDSDSTDSASEQTLPSSSTQIPPETQESNLPGRTEPTSDGTKIQLLSTAEELVDFSKWVNENQENQQSNPTDILWKLENDIDLTGIDWTPIGTVHWDEEVGMSDWATRGFGGTFDGQNHRITGLRVVGKEIYGTGFFGKLYGSAYVKNLHIQGDVMGERSVGGLVGLGGSFGESSTVIENCSFTGTVHGLTDGIGGLVGETGENTQIRRCYAEAQVTGASGVGGLVGSANNESRIKDSYCRGVVHAQLPEKNEEETGISHQDVWGTHAPEELHLSSIGGFAGGTYNADLVNSYADVTVKTYAGTNMLGAFVGYHSGRDAGCYYNAQKNSQWKIGYAYSGTNSVFTAVPLADAQFKQQSAFADWDFTNIWEMDAKTGLVALQKSNRNGIPLSEMSHPV